VIPKSPVIRQQLTTSEERHVRDLQQRLAEAEATIEALLSGQIDAVVDATNGTPVLLAKAQQALRESEERYREQAALLDIAHEAIMVKDLDGRILYWNKGAERIFGWSAAETVGRNAEDFLHDGAVEFHAALTTLLAAGDWKGEQVRHTKDGHDIVVESGWSLVRDEQGRPKSILAIHTDITERREAVETIRAADERMRFVLEAAGVGIWDLNFKTGVLQWSEILEAQHGLMPGTFGGTLEAFIERVYPQDRDAVLTTMKAHESGRNFSIQHRTLWPDGTVRWLSGAGRILVDEEGEPVRGVGISQDVTERRTLEAQFLQAQKMEAIGRLAGGVAHDFNNLLTVILGFCELLLADGDSGDPRQADIGEIHKAGTRAAGLTRQLLAFSRKEIIEPTRLDLNIVLVDMQVMLGRLIGEDVKVLLDLRPELAGVLADRGQIEQIVLNLAVNAKDAMPQGGVLTIETDNVNLDDRYATTHLGVKAGPHVALTMSDTGTGMSPEVQARLFEPFFTTKGEGKGTGLGLATVHGIVARSGGHVSVYSQVGKGTSFKVLFPRSDATTKVVDAPTSPARLTGAVTVLVVEDAEGLRALAAKMLQRQGYTVLVAASAEEALRLFDENPSIDVLLTDVVMPGASGPQLTMELTKRRSTLKVVYMSGYTDEAIVHHGVLEPGITFLHKPFTAEALGRKIREALDR
jgi:two-component system cell cycle sensor histidine kinase/response regulator CckA